MKTIIRNQLFETNSSSSHTLTLKSKSEMEKPYNDGEHFRENHVSPIRKLDWIEGYLGALLMNAGSEGLETLKKLSTWIKESLQDIKVVFDNYTFLADVEDIEYDDRVQEFWRDEGMELFEDSFIARYADSESNFKQYIREIVLNDHYIIEVSGYYG